MSGFVHLHLHSEYSLLDGACRISDIPKAAKALGQTSVAITDHGVMYGAIAFYKACVDEGVKPIIGCEVYVSPRTRFDKTREFDRDKCHLVLLAKDDAGYHNLIKLVSRGFTEGFYSKPTVDLELLTEYSEGIVALSACLSGYIPKRIVEGNYNDALDYAKKLDGIFGRGNFYLELQDHKIPEEKTAIEGILKIHAETGIPLVATNDVHYLKRTDAEIQSVLMCVQTNSTVADGRAPGFDTDEFYFKSEEEMSALFGMYDGAIENTAKIAEMCNVTFNFKKLYLPAFPLEDGVKAKDYLRQLVYEGLEKRVERGQIVYDETYDAEAYKMRIEYELVVITSMGYCDYFLIVRDFVNHAKDEGIPVGPGRGSGAGSLVAYLLQITDIDPLRYRLVFEAFLNPQRVSMPDFDIDFCYDRRDEVIKYVIDKYGEDHVSQIITFGTLAARAAVRDVGRALGMTYADVDAVAKLIPRQLGITLKEAMQGSELRSLYESSPNVKRLLDTAAALEGMPRHSSTHAAGVVITDKPTSEYVPLALSSDSVVTQYDMDTIASLGLLKFDFLALRYLTIIADTEKHVRRTDPNFSIDKIPLDDAETFALMGQGHTDGMFQLESGGMRQMLIQFKPESVEDIMIAIALYRPGPMDAIPTFLENRKKRDSIVYQNDALREILEETCGCIVYQEQVMQIFRVIAGYSYGKADIVRRAISKKKSGVIEEERGNFVNGATQKGMSAEAAEVLFESMIAFSNYGFKKSHAAAYALISYRTAYLKCHYPAFYLSALLTSVLGNMPKTAQYIAEAKSRRIKILPPDINLSEKNFNADGNTIRVGLLALKNVGPALVDAIIEERRESPFASFVDFVERMPQGELNKTAVEAFINAGAFDSTGVTRSSLLACYREIMDARAERSRRNIEGQLNMFAQAGGAGVEENAIPQMEEFPIRRKLALERESTGLYLSGHLLDEYARHIDSLNPAPIGEILDAFDSPESGRFKEKDNVTVAGLITKRSLKQTKNGDSMAFLTLEDRYAEIEVIVFPKLLEKFSELLAVDSAVSVMGELSQRDDEPPKLLLRDAGQLYSDAEYVPVQTVAPAPQQPITPNIPSQYLTPNIPSQYLTPNIPSQYLAPTPPPPPTQPQPTEPPRQEKPSRLFIRVPGLDTAEYKRALSLVEIFEGFTEVVFYDVPTKRYIRMTSGGADISGCLIRELGEILGRENVVVK